MERLPDGNIVDNEGNIRPLEDFLGPDGTLDFVEDRTHHFEPAGSMVNAADTDVQARYQAESDRYDALLEARVKGLGNYAMARKSLEADGIFQPVDPTENDDEVSVAVTEVDSVVDSARKMTDKILAERLAAAEAISDPVERARNKDYILAEHRLHEERKRQPAGPVRHHGYRH